MQSVTTPNFRHSGALGDLIFSLSIVSKAEPSHFIVNLEYCEKQSLIRFGYGDLKGAHAKTITQESYEMLLPLLLKQPYIKEVSSWREGEPDPTNTVNLDDFKYIFARSFKGNYVECYHKAFNIPFNPKTDYSRTWLYTEPKKIAPIVVARSARYHGEKGDECHREINRLYHLQQDAIFLGTDAEHRAYEEVIGGYIKHYKIHDYWEMANVIAGAEFMITNQTFAHSLAMGIGQNTLLETFIHRPLHENECYFPRGNCRYF